MKKIFFAAVSLMFLVSCQITERMYLSETGMVKQETEIDFSALMSFAFSPEQQDSMRLTGEFPIDTIVSLADINEVANMDSETSEYEKAFNNAFQKSKVRFLMSENQGVFTLMNNEMSVKDYNAYQKNIEKAYQEFKNNDKKSAGEMMLTGYGTMLQYSLNGKTFERNSLNSSFDFSLVEEGDDEEMSTKDMLGMYTYKIEYHFPKTVKSVDHKGATISTDGKTVTVVATMSEILENPEKFNFKVEME